MLRALKKRTFFVSCGEKNAKKRFSCKNLVELADAQRVTTKIFVAGDPPESQLLDNQGLINSTTWLLFVICLFGIWGFRFYPPKQP